MCGPGGVHWRGPFGDPVRWASGDPGVKKPPLEENQHVGRRDGWGKVPLVRHSPQHRRPVVYGAVPNGFGGAVREALRLLGRSRGLGRSTSVG